MNQKYLLCSFLIVFLPLLVQADPVPAPTCQPTIIPGKEYLPCQGYCLFRTKAEWDKKENNNPKWPNPAPIKFTNNMLLLIG
jgi:hypothetical protein